MKRIKMLAAAVMLAAMTIACLIGGEVQADVWLETTIPPQYVQYCEEIGAKFHVSPELLEAIIEHESGGDPSVVNRSSGCVGLGQINPTIHADRIRRLGVTDLFDPYQNITVIADILVECFETYGDDLELVLERYGGYKTTEAQAEQNDFSDYAKWVSNRSFQLERIHGK